MIHRGLYCDVIKWFENKDSLMNLIELVTTGYRITPISGSVKSRPIVIWLHSRNPRNRVLFLARPKDFLFFNFFK